MKVSPLGMTQINWTDFVQSAERVFGDSPIRVLDKNKIQPGDIYSYLVTLGELEQPGSGPRNAIKNATFNLYHVHASFIIEMTIAETKVLTNLSGLTVSIYEGKESETNLIIISGNLATWQQVVPQQLKTRVMNSRTAIQRQLFNQIYTWFNHLNLVDLFDCWYRVEITGGTFILEKKP